MTITPVLARAPRRSARVAVASSAALALLLAACGSDEDEPADTPTDTAEDTTTDAADPTDEATEEPTDDATGETEEPGGSDELLATVDTMFGPVEIPQPDDGELTVVALGWSDAEVALALGVQPVAVYDWMGFGEDQNGVGEWATDLFDTPPTVLVNVSGEVDLEQIQGLNPDLILNVRSANDEQLFNDLSRIAPTVYGPEGAPAYATAWRDQTQQIADALGQSDAGAALIADVEADIADAAAANPEFEGLTAVVGTKFGDAYGAYVDGDARWDLLSELGFVAPAEIEELDTGGGFFGAVSLEQVLVFEADVAVLFPIGYTLEELESDPLLASLDVVTEGRAVLLPPDGELSEAFSAASILSIPIALEGIVPQLAEAAANVQ